MKILFPLSHKFDTGEASEWEGLQCINEANRNVSVKVKNPIPPTRWLTVGQQSADSLTTI